MDTTIKRKGVPLLNYMILLIVFLFLVALAMAGSPTGPGNTGDLVPTPPQTGTKNTVCGDKAFFTATKDHHRFKQWGNLACYKAYRRKGALCCCNKLHRLCVYMGRNACGCFL